MTYRNMAEVEAALPSVQESFSLSQDLFLDFEAELASLLRPSASYSSSSSSSLSNNVRRASSGSGQGDDPEFDADGTLPCSRLSYDVLVSNIRGRSYVHSRRIVQLTTMVPYFSVQHKWSCLPGATQDPDPLYFMPWYS